MLHPAPLLVTFAVKEEARAFQKIVSSAGSDVTVLLTGIGKTNASRAIRSALASERRRGVLTCGFAGGLKPGLAAGTVLFSADDDIGLSGALLAAGALRAEFHCADRVAATVEEKRALRQSTGADAVEMESGVIRGICREQGVASATVRVISDSATDDLPLDFNRLLDAEQNLHYGNLALLLLARPGRIGALLKLRKQTKAAAESLAGVLLKVISARAQVHQ